MVAITSAKFTFFGCIPLFNLFLGGFPSGSVVKNPLAMQEMQRLRFDPWDRKIPWRQVWQPTPVFLAGESHGQGSLEGYSPFSPKALDPTEVTEHAVNLFLERSLCASLSAFWKVFVLFCFVLIRVKLNVLFHKSGEMVCWILHCSLVAQSCPTLCNPMDCVHPHATRQAPLSMGFPRQEYRSGLPFPSPGDLPVIEPACLALAGRFFTADSLPPGGKWSVRSLAIISGWAWILSCYSSCNLEISHCPHHHTWTLYLICTSSLNLSFYLGWIQDMSRAT